MLYGNPDGGTSTIVPGFTASNVNLTVTFTNSVPTAMTVSITGSGRRYEADEDKQAPRRCNGRALADFRPLFDAADRRDGFRTVPVYEQAVVERVRVAARYGAIHDPTDATAITNVLLYDQSQTPTDERRTFFNLNASMVSVSTAGAGTDNYRLTVTLSGYSFSRSASISKLSAVSYQLSAKTQRGKRNAGAPTYQLIAESGKLTAS